jgi:hypothetical protein
MINNASENKYKVIYHYRGYIRIELLSPQIFYGLRRLPLLLIAEGIKHSHMNPFAGHIVILYDPEKIDILNHLETMTSCNDFKMMYGVEQ